MNRLSIFLLSVGLLFFTLVSVTYAQQTAYYEFNCSWQTQFGVSSCRPTTSTCRTPSSFECYVPADELCTQFTDAQTCNSQGQSLDCRRVPCDTDDTPTFNCVYNNQSHNCEPSTGTNSSCPPVFGGKCWAPNINFCDNIGGSRDCNAGSAQCREVPCEGGPPQCVYRATCTFQAGMCLISSGCPGGYQPSDPNFCQDPTGFSCQQHDLYSCCEVLPTNTCPVEFPVCSSLTGSFCSNAPGIARTCALTSTQTGSCCVNQDPSPYCGGHLQECCGSVSNPFCDLGSGLECKGVSLEGLVCCNPGNDPSCPGAVTLTPPPPRETPTPDYSEPYSRGLRWPPQTTPPDYYAPDYPVDNVKEHVQTDGERAIPRPYVSCSSTSDTEFHSLRPYQASPCNQRAEDIAMMCANRLTLTGEYRFTSSNCRCSCGGCSCGGGGGGSCSCHCDCQNTFTLHSYVDVFDAELPVMGNTEDKIVNSQEQPDPEGIDHYAKVNEYVSWYLSGVNQKAEYGTPDSENPASVNYIVDFSGPVKKLLSWDSLAVARNQQVDDAGSGGVSRFDSEGRHDQIVACQSEPGIAAACYTEGGQKLRITTWSGNKAPVMSDFDSPEEYQEAYNEWVEVPQNRLFQYIPPSSTEDRKGLLDGNGTVAVTGPGSVTNQEVLINPAELFYPHMEESRQLADLLQRTYLTGDFIKDDLTGDGIPDIETEKIKHVMPAEPPTCDLVRARTNPGDTINPTELDVTAVFTVATSCEVPGISDCLCDEDPDTGIEDCDCSCRPGGAVCPGGEANVNINLNNYMPLANENFSRLVASPYSPVQRIFPKIEANMPIQGFYDMPAYSSVDYKAVGDLELTSVRNPGNYPLPPKLFYPHIGSIHQYFLNCIQTAMRPQGYSRYCPQGELAPEDQILTDLPIRPDDPGSIDPPSPRPPDVVVLPYPVVRPPTNVPPACQNINGVPIENIAAGVFAESNNGAQLPEVQNLIAWVLFNRSQPGSGTVPYTGAMAIMYQNMYNDCQQSPGCSMPPPSSDPAINAQNAYQYCLGNQSACQNQYARFQNTLSIVIQACMDMMAGDTDPTNGSTFFSMPSDLTRPGLTFATPEELRQWLIDISTARQNDPRFSNFQWYVSRVFPNQSWVSGSTTEVYSWGFFIFYSGNDGCVPDQGCSP